MAEEEIPSFKIRPLVESDIPQALRIWGGTGMFQGVSTLRTYLQMDPEGLWVAATDQGEVLASCGALFMRPDLAFLGFYAVQEKLRGKGLGGQLLTIALDRLKREGDANCALNTAEDHLSNYRDRAGFVHVSPWQSGAFVGPTPPHLFQDDASDQRVDILSESPNEDSLWEAILEYDRQAVHGIRRDKLLALTKAEDTVIFATCPATDNDDERTVKLQGYGVARRNVHGQCMVGPLYADCYEVALPIVKALVRAHPASQQGLILMTLDNNPGSLRLAEDECNLQRVDRCTRLFKRFDPALEPNNGGVKVFAQHDLNFINF